MTARGIVALGLATMLASGAPAQDDGRAARPSGPDLARGDRPRLVLNSPGFSSRVNDLAFSRDGRWLAAAGSDKLVRIWDVATGRLRHTLRGFSGTKGSGDGICSALAFSPDGAALVVGVTDQTSEGTIRVYDMADLSEIAALLPGAHAEGGVEQLTFSDDGRFLASAGFDGAVVVWDWPARRPLGTIPTVGGLAYLGFLSGTPELVVADQQGLDVWSARHVRPTAALGRAQRAELFPDPAAAARSSDRFADVQAKLQDLAGIVPLFGGQFTVRELDLASGRALLGGQGKDAGGSVFWVGLWRLPGGGGPAPLSRDLRYKPSALAVSPDGALLAAGDFFGDIAVWDVATGVRRYQFRAEGLQFYRVGFDPSGRQLGFGARPFAAGTWDFNHYGAPEWTFDFGTRELRPGAPDSLTDEATQLGDRTLAIEHPGGAPYALVSTRAGRVEGRYTLPPPATPWCFSYLKTRAPGFEAPVVLGQQNGQLTLLDPRTMLCRRIFIGPELAVAAVAESPDGRFLASASLDRTIRIYSLTDLKEDDAWPDFDSYGDWVVNYVAPGGASERAGIRVGDHWVKMDGVDMPTLWQRYLEGRWPYRLGRRVALDLERGGRPYRVEVPLLSPTDLAEPLLSFLAAEEGEWVAWTPQGYYDASLNGDRLIGWQVNQGRARAAKYYLAQQFREDLFRPDVIRRVLETGNVAEAVALADAEAPHRRTSGPVAIEHDLARLEPPRVRILSPASGTRTRTPRITVHVEAVSQNALPVQEVILLVDGVQVSERKGIALEPGAAAGGASSAGDRRRLEVRQEVELTPGRRNVIEAVARNAKSLSERAAVEVVCQAPEPPDIRPALYVLAIGISRYKHLPETDQLRYAHRDAEEFAATWKAQEGTFYRTVETRLLIDADATPEAIRDGLQWLDRSATQHDVAILFASGHGVLDDRRNYYLATHSVDPARLWATGVPYTEIAGLIRDMRCKFYLYIDTCYSGAITGAKAADFHDALRDLVTAESGTVVFTSSSARETSRERPDWGHGAFTKAFLDLVQDPTRDLNRPPDGFLSVKEIDFQLTLGVKQLTGGAQHMSTHYPDIFTDYIVARYVR